MKKLSSECRDFKFARGFYIKLHSLVTSYIVGFDKEIKIVVASLLANGHILFDGIPGIGKTALAYTLSRALGLDFKRIQFTPDLLPSDIIGTMVYDQRINDFVFKKGPIFANIVLADEINRANPRTQSALLQAMQEKKVTVEGRDYYLPRPFMVIATQNPIEFTGVFPLPEALLDRFMVMVKMDVPDKDSLREIINRANKLTKPFDEWSIEPIVSRDELECLSKMVYEVDYTGSIEGRPNIMDYIVELSEATWRHPDVEYGVSPRASLYLLQLSRAIALLDGRDYVIPDDVKEAIHYVFPHRIILKPEARASRKTPYHVIKDILETVNPPVP